ARALPRCDPERQPLFAQAQARAQHACTAYALHAYVQRGGKSWLGEQLDRLTLQPLASRSYRTAHRRLVGQAERVPLKGRHQLDPVEGKTNTSGIRWCGDQVAWQGLVRSTGWACPVKYVRLVRRRRGCRTSRASAIASSPS